MFLLLELIYLNLIEIIKIKSSFLASIKLINYTLSLIFKFFIFITLKFKNIFFV